MLATKPRTKPLKEGQVAYAWFLGVDIYSEKNEAVLKGLAWACGASDDPTRAGELGARAEAWYKQRFLEGPAQ